MSESQNNKGLFEQFCDFFLGGHQREIWLHILTALIFWLLLHFIWVQSFDSLRGQDYFLLKPEKILFMNKPLWVSPWAEIEAVKKNSNVIPKDQQSDEPYFLSTIDPNLVPNLINIFSSCPWTRQIRSLKIEYPASVKIDAEFRQPIAFVEAANSTQNASDSQPGNVTVAYFMVDTEGHLFPQDYVAALLSKNSNDIRKYMSIHGITSSPRGYGELWGDNVVEEAARLAEFLQNDFAELGIYTIVVPKKDENDDSPFEIKSLKQKYTLITDNGKEIIWGSFPMSKVIRACKNKSKDLPQIKDEAFKKELPKLEKLRNLAGNGKLDELPPEQFPIDLSSLNQTVP